MMMLRSRSLLVGALSSILAACLGEGSGEDGHGGGLDVDCACPSGVDMGSADAAGPSGNTWRVGAPVPAARTELFAVAARQRIYVLGGLTPQGIDRVDVYDPRTDRWTDGPRLPAAAPRHHISAATYKDRIYIVGGYSGSSFTPTARTFALNERGDGWEERQNQPIPRGAATAQAIGDLIIVAGGVSQGQVTPRAHAYDPVKDMWQERKPMKVAREHLASCAVDGKMLVAAGRTGANNLAALESYDPVTDEWTTLPSMPSKRGGLGAAAIGTVCYVIGGEELGKPPPNNTFTNNEGFDARTGTWMSYAGLPSPRHGLGVVAFEGEIYVISGGPTAGFSFSDLVEIYRP